MSPPTRSDGSTSSIAHLLAQAALGDEQAFAQIYDDTAARVYGLVLRIVRDPVVAEQVTREVFVQAWVDSHSYDKGRGSGSSWLLTSAHRRAVDTVRAAEDAVSVVASTSSASTIQTTRVETAHSLRVSTALSLIVTAQREAVELAYFGGYTQGQVATLTGAPAEAGPSLIRDALIRLRDLLDDVA